MNERRKRNPSARSDTGEPYHASKVSWHDARLPSFCTIARKSSGKKQLRQAKEGRKDFPVPKPGLRGEHR